MISRKQVDDYLLSMPNVARGYPFGEDVAVYKTFVPNKMHSSSRADGAQSAAKQRTDPYTKYDEGAAEAATPRSAANCSGALSSDEWQAAVARGEGEEKMFALVPEKTKIVSISLKCDPQLAEVLREKYETVMPGYHLNKKHWNTIVLSGQLSWEEIQGFIVHSYNLVTGK